MNYQIEVISQAEKELQELPGYVRAQARQMIRNLGIDPRPFRSKELRGKPSYYRIWLMGKWRIVYRIDDEDRTVKILRIRLKDDVDYESIDETP